MTEPEHLQFYLEELRSGDPRRQIIALQKLKKLNTDPMGAVLDILPLLAFENAVIRSSSAQTLGVIAPLEDETVCSALLLMMNDPDENVRNEVYASLGLLQCKEAQEPLKTISFQDQNWMLRSTAVVALDEFKNPAFLPVFWEKLHDEHVIVQSDAAIAICHLALPESQSDIEPIAYSSKFHPKVRIHLLLFLHELGDAKAFPEICTMLDTMEPDELLFPILQQILDLTGEPQLTKEMALELMAVLERLLKRSEETKDPPKLAISMITSLQLALHETYSI